MLQIIGLDAKPAGFALKYFSGLLGRRLSEADNTARQAALLNELTGCGLKFIYGVGLDSQDAWLSEASFLVLSLSLEATRILASKHEKNAVVWCDKDAAAQLVLLR